MAAESTTTTLNDVYYSAIISPMMMDYAHDWVVASQFLREFSLIGQDQSSGDPSKLRVPLDQGVTVIAAHGCSYGLAFYEKFYRTFLDLAQRYPNFFADISALTLPNRMAMLLRLRRHPELSERLLFGTDYPLPVFSWACWGRMGLGPLGEILRTKNPFDRQYLICSELGVRFGSFDALSQRMSRS